MADVITRCSIKSYRIPRSIDIIVEHEEFSEIKMLNLNFKKSKINYTSYFKYIMY